ncbi:MAG TPA: hypothetical protein VJH94_02245 [Candidatus Paceibacterota bacterium]
MKKGWQRRIANTVIVSVPIVLLLNFAVSYFVPNPPWWATLLEAAAVSFAVVWVFPWLYNCWKRHQSLSPFEDVADSFNKIATQVKKGKAVEVVAKYDPERKVWDYRLMLPIRR